MVTAPGTVYLHIGLHKTGTTYLQRVLAANTPELAEQGVFIPNRRGLVVHAVDDLQGRRPRNMPDERITGAWQALVTAVKQSGMSRAVISEERLSMSGVRAAQRLAHSFEGSELHVIVTVRDLPRTLVSSWEEAVRWAATWTWQEYLDAVRDPARRGTNPARGFWVRQDLAQICACWETIVPPERLHIVTVPPPGADRRQLLGRFAACLGVDPAGLVDDPNRSNESTGVAGTEVIRRLNERLDGRLNQREYARAVRFLLARSLRGASRGVVPAKDLDWFTARAEQDCAMLRDRGYHIVGDLDDLMPVAVGGREPDDVADAELLDAALGALTTAVENYGRAWWARRRRDAPLEARGSLAASRARSMAFRLRQAVLDFGDRAGPLGRAASVGYRLRTARHERAARAARRRRS